MSGRNLPSQCSKSGASYCAWQFPNVSMTAATDPKSYAERWSVNPGFLDPFHVTYCCLRRLKAATFVNVKYNSRVKGDHGQAVPDKSQLCPGLQIYLNPMIQEEQIDRDVKLHISNGSAENVAAVIRRYPCIEHALLFLMKYLKERGPLMKLKYRKIDELNASTANPRFLVNTFLTTLCDHELEFQSMVLIGDYLNFVTFVAYAHDLFWLKGILVEAWGPLLLDFINVGEATSENLTPTQKAGKVKLLMTKLIEGIPWEKMKSQENFKITINPQINDSYLKRKATEANYLMDKLTVRPSNQTTLLSGASIASVLDNVGRAAPAEADKTDESGEDPAALAIREQKEMQKKKEEEKVKRTAEDAAEKRDYSDQYGYTPEYAAKHAPHGMCPPGTDPTVIKDA